MASQWKFHLSSDPKDEKKDSHVKSLKIVSNRRKSSVQSTEKGHDAPSEQGIGHGLWEASREEIMEGPAGCSKESGFHSKANEKSLKGFKQENDMIWILL